TTMPDCSYALKPVSSTRSLYVPGGRAGMAYNPPSVVTVLAVTLVAALVAVTVAPGMTAPELSVTVPVRTPRSDWACAGTHITRKSNAVEARRILDISTPRKGNSQGWREFRLLSEGVSSCILVAVLDVIDRILALYRERGARMYAGEPVTIEMHVRQ